ncbi:MAG TPA: lysylphosphatidylglycerol synthase transmembrane domain-containing protein [Methylomirabilota bacterium]|nr:lysylphosphatidylglycerol synthase transmembrane domain-containing protein [Methylomirabilota bacterium]
MLWIIHSIFVNEARLSEGAEAFNQRPRLEQWSRGWRVGPSALLRRLGQIPPGPLAVSVALMGGTLLLGVARWQTALHVQGCHLRWGRDLEISFVAHFYNSFLLGSTGGDVMKAWYAARETHHRKTEAVLTVVIDRLIGLWAMLLFACVMMVFNFPVLFESRWLRLLSLVVTGMMLAGTAFFVLAFWGGVSRTWSGARHWLRRLPRGEWLEYVLDACRRFGRARFYVLKALGLSMLLNAVCVLQFIVLARGLGLSIAPIELFVVVPIVICLAALPITPSGLGVRENLFVQILHTLGVHPTDALSLSLLAYGGSLFWSLVGGGVYATLREKHHLAEAELAAKNNDTPGAAR